MPVKTASSETTAKLQPVITDGVLVIPPRTTETVTAFVNHPPEWNTTGTVTPLEKYTEIKSLLIFHSRSTMIDKRTAVRLTNTMELPYLIKKITQIAEFSIVTLEQCKHIKPVDMATLGMIPQVDPDLPACLNEVLRTNAPEQQPTLSSCRHQKILRNLRITTEYRHESSRKYLKLKRTKNSTHNRRQNPKTKCSNDLNTLTHLQRKEKEAIEDILVDYYAIFARHRMDIVVNTDFKVKLTPKDDKVVYS